ALAPVLLLPASLAWIVLVVAGASGVWFAVHAWIAGTLLGAALPSRADLRIALPALSLLAAVAVPLAIWHLAT
ncbi:MAG TPA: hypothetical protein VFE72_08940, partial [Lysobacter sp.]|nr:hypothetical protein [Lysobacter sp.]